jgi:DNA-binding transcriptional MerR regulator
MEALTVSQAARRTGWSPRMLRYLERSCLVVPTRSRGGYRLYGLRELNQLHGLDLLRRRFAVGLDEIAFALRLRNEPELRAAVDSWLAAVESRPAPAWVEWEQHKQERLLAA